MTTAAWHKVRVGNRLIGSQQRVLATGQAEALLAAHEAWPGRSVRYIAPVESATNADAKAGGSAGAIPAAEAASTTSPVDETGKDEAVGEVDTAALDDAAAAAIATPGEERQEAARVDSAWRLGSDYGYGVSDTYHVDTDYGYGVSDTYEVGTYATADSPDVDYDWWRGGYATSEPEFTHMQDETSHVQEHVR